MEKFQKLLSIFLSVILALSIITVSPQKVIAASQVDSLITIAEKEIGGKERTKYGSPAGQNWCAYFVSWCARQANISKSIIPNLSQADGFWYAENATLHYFFKPWLQKQKDWGIEKGTYCSSRNNYTPKPGDMIFFRWKGTDTQYTFSHIGIVYKVDSSKVYTIEGNSGGKVQKREYSRNSEEIVAYGTPNYTDSGTPIDTSTQTPVSKQSPPASLKAERASDSTAKISWNSVSGASYYVEYRSPNTNNQWVADKDYSSTGFGKSTSYVATRLGNHKYEFRVYSVDSAKNKSNPSNVLTYTHNKTAPVTAPTAAPTNLKLNNVASRPDASGSVYALTANVGDTLTLTWSAVSNANKYKVEPMVWNGSEWALVGSTYTKEVGGTTVSYDNLLAGVWVFKVTAGNSAGWSSNYARWNKASVVATQTAPDAIPTNLKLNNVASRPDASGSVYALTANVGDTLTLTWDAVNNATKYKVEPMVWNGSEWALVGSTYTKEVSGTTVSYDNLLAGVWVFKVTAGNPAGWSSNYARWNKASVVAKESTGKVTIQYFTERTVQYPPAPYFSYGGWEDIVYVNAGVFSGEIDKVTYFNSDGVMVGYSEFQRESNYFKFTRKDYWYEGGKLSYYVINDLDNNGEVVTAIFYDTYGNPL